MLLGLCFSHLAQAQSQAASVTAVPRLVKYSGTLHDGVGKPLTGITGATFALYSDQSNGAPLWIETQNVTPDANGHYTVSLGATQSDGLPLDLFSSGEARWLGVQPSGQPEQPRVLLLSVPYALKAADAETVGGLPASAFVLAAPPSGGPSPSPENSGTPAPVLAPANPVDPDTITKNFIPLFADNAGTLSNSTLFQSGSGSSAKIGVGTTAPTATLDVKGATALRGIVTLPATGTATATAGKNSQPFNLGASVFNSTTQTPVAQTFRWQAEPVGNNTANASGSLNLLYATGSGQPMETGFNIASNGQLTFAPGQTFPGTGTITSVTAGSGLSGGGSSGDVSLGLLTSCANGQVLQWNGTIWACTTPNSGTITGVTAGTDLLGGGTSGNVTLNLDTNQTDARYAQLGASNTFTQTQFVNGVLVGTALWGGGLSTGGDVLAGLSDGLNGSASLDLWAGSSGGGDLIIGFLYNTPTSDKVLEVGASGQLSVNSEASGYGASFTKGSLARAATLAAMQVLNASTSGEAAWLSQGSTSDTAAVIKLVLPSGSTSNFLECNIPDGTRKCHITTAGTYVGGSDFAEALPVRSQRELYEPGDVLVMSSDGKTVQKTTSRYSRRVVGVYSTRPAVLGAEKDGVSRVDPDDVPVAITGIVPAKVTTENGPIQVGDLLVTSSRPGYAMRATDPRLMLGAVVGKAMEPLAAGRGMVKVLVILR
jgi:hypothetical protein